MFGVRCPPTDHEQIEAKLRTWNPNLEPRTSNQELRTWNVEPRTSNLEPLYAFAKSGPRTSRSFAM